MNARFLTILCVAGATFATPALAQTDPQPMPPTMDAARPGSAVVADEASARTLFESSGHGAISDVQRDGTGWTATATKDGEQVKLRMSREGNVIRVPDPD